MAYDPKKSEGPTCACGKTDLYDEWLKQNEAGEKEEALTPTSQVDIQKSSTDTAGNGDTEPVQIKE